MTGTERRTVFILFDPETRTYLAPDPVGWTLLAELAREYSDYRTCRQVAGALSRSEDKDIKVVSTDPIN